MLFRSIIIIFLTFISFAVDAETVVVTQNNKTRKFLF